MIAAFLAGALAGYAIAIPVGAIAVLIVETGVRRGFRLAAAAGAGAATADFLYASLAMAAGSAAAPVLAPWSIPLRAGAAVVLLGIGLRGLAAVWRRIRSSPAADDGSDGSGDRTPPSWRRAAASTYGRFLGLTLLNPSTVIYFAALVLALPVLDDDALARPAFVAGAGLASLSWQIVLAALAALAHHRLPARFQVGISLLGNVMICGFAVALARGVIAP